VTTITYDTYDNPRIDFDNQPIHANNFRGSDGMLPQPTMRYDSTHLHPHAMNDYPRSPFDYTNSQASGSRFGAGSPANRGFVDDTVGRPYMGSSADEFSWGAQPPKSAQTSGRNPLGGIANRASPALHPTKSVSGMVFQDQVTMEPCSLYFRRDEDVVILADHLQVLGNLGLKITDSLQRYLPSEGFWSDVDWRDPIIVAEDDFVMLKCKGLHVQM